jgi:transposase-like protein
MEGGSLAAFLLRSWAKSFSLRDINQMTDEQIETKLKLVRWPQTNGEPVCPECGCDAVYAIQTRAQYRCKLCYHTFSLTSGTVFHSSKLPLRSILQLILLWANAVKGESALQIRRDVGLNHKSAFVMLHKLREVLHNTRDETPMDGVVEMDGMYVGGSIRHANRKIDRPEQNAPPTPKNCVIALCQRNPNHRGTLRVLTSVVRTETAEAVREIATAYIVPHTTIFADEHAAYDALAGWFDLKRVNHKRAYRSDGGENINLCENMFARFRRLLVGQTHKLTPKYLANYASETCYRVNTYRWQNGRIMGDILEKALQNGPTNTWRGYWRKRPPRDAVPQMDMAA